VNYPQVGLPILSLLFVFLVVSGEHVVNRQRCIRRLAMFNCAVLLSTAASGRSINPFPDKQLNLHGTVPEQVSHFSSLSIFYFGCKTISRLAACRLIILHHEQNIKSELIWQTC